MRLSGGSTAHRRLYTCTSRRSAKSTSSISSTRARPAKACDSVGSHGVSGNAYGWTVFSATAPRYLFASNRRALAFRRRITPQHECDTPFGAAAATTSPLSCRATASAARRVGETAVVGASFAPYVLSALGGASAGASAVLLSLGVRDGDTRRLLKRVDSQTAEGAASILNRVSAPWSWSDTSGDTNRALNCPELPNSALSQSARTPALARSQGSTVAPPLQLAEALV